MKDVMKLILSVVLCLCVCAGAVARHHHHTADGQFCLCLEATHHAHHHDHADGDTCDHCCNHGSEPHDCQRAAFNLTCDQPLRYALPDFPAPLPVIEPTPTLTLREPAATCETIIYNNEAAPPPLAGNTHSASRRGPPCR